MNKRVIAINDLSGLGRCSLTAAISVLTAMGLQVSPLPTAVLSAQTGFEGYVLRDLTEDMGLFAGHWKSLGLRADGIYSGFLASHRQIEKVAAIMDDFGTGGALKLVDPVLGDNGVPYPFCTPELVAEMRGLAARADIATPNLTEAFLLTGQAYHKNAGVESAKKLAEEITELGAGAVVVTGVPEGDMVCNVVYSGGAARVLRSPRVGGSFSGTGDLFASALCGGCLMGAELFEAASLAARFVSAALKGTAADADTRYGVEYEKQLGLLCEETKKWKDR